MTTTLFVISLTLALLTVGLMIFKRVPEWDLFERLAIAIVPLVVGLPTVALATLWLRVPDNPWNGARLAPTVALEYGYPLYCSREAGPILSTIYPPGNYFAFLPACVTSHPSAALLLAGALNMAYVCVPVGRVTRTSARS